jgi:acetyl-CoA carboxylase biotin carboxyl carrier protein
MNIEEIKEIIKVLEKTDIVEFELEKSGVRVRIRKGSEDWMVSTGAQEKRSLKPIPSSQASAEADHAEKEDKTSQIQQLIKAPIVGTFYRSPSPDAESYVEVGTIVKKGQIVCIIEAMKLMNEIESEVDGKIIEILTENAHPVEFGEPLFAIEPQ